MKNFIKSFKFDRIFLKCMVYDLMFILIVFGLIAISFSAVISNSKPIYDLSNSGIKTQNILSQTGGSLRSIPTAIFNEGAEAYLQIKNLLIIGVILTIFLTILILGISSIIKGVIWSSITGFDYNKKYVLRLFKLNIIWYLCWIGLISMTYLMFTKTISIVLIASEIILMFILTPLIRVYYSPSKKTHQVFTQLVQSFKKIHWLLLFLVIIYSVYLVGIVLISLISIILPIVAIVLLIVLTFWYINWSRKYLYLYTQNLK